jgi:hypothetical protein
MIDELENYIHRTIIENLPAITPIGLAQAVFGGSRTQGAVTPPDPRY